VSNKNHSEAEMFPEVPKYAEDSHLGYWIKGGGRFVGDHERGITDDGLGDQDALPLAAAQLVGIGSKDTVRFLRKKSVENFARSVAQIILA